MYTTYLGDSIKFTITSEDTSLNSFSDFKMYLYNSIKSYEIIRDEEWKLDREQNRLSISIPPSKTKDMIAGDYNFVIKGIIEDIETGEKYLQSQRALNIIRIEKTPARRDFIEDDDNSNNECKCCRHGETY